MIPILATLSALDAAATKGPWRNDLCGHPCGSIHSDYRDPGEPALMNTFGGSSRWGAFPVAQSWTGSDPMRAQRVADASFIAAARSAIPALLAVAMAAEAVVELGTHEQIKADGGQIAYVPDGHLDALRSALAALRGAQGGRPDAG